MFSFIRRLWKGSPPVNPPSRSRRPELESLEDRTVPALFGSEIHVNSTTNGDQHTSANASSANGQSVVVWVREVTSTTNEIRARMFNASGAPTTGEILVASSSGGKKNRPSVAMDNAGNWKVVWDQFASASSSDLNVQLARFNNKGQPLGTIKAIANSTKNEWDPSIAVNAAGDFVVSYTYTYSSSDHDIYARMYDKNAAYIKTLNVSTNSVDALRSEVARCTGSSSVFAIAFAYNKDIILRRYGNTGNLIGTDSIRTNSNVQNNPAIAMSNTGHIAVAWQELIGGDYGILGRTVTNINGGMGSVFTVSNSTPASEVDPSVAMDRSDGDFVVTYRAASTVYLREYNSNGAAKGGSQLVATASTYAAPAISINGSDNYLLTYTTLNRSNDSGKGIFARRGHLS